MPAFSIAALLIALLVFVLPAVGDDQGPAEATDGDKVELRVADMFSDHMVLQRHAAVPIWGRAKAGTSVTVKLDGPETREAVAAAGEDGRWRVDLDALTDPGPYTLTVSAGETVATFNDVLVGEVWFCSGQSNMEWSLTDSEDAATDIPAAEDDRLRIYTVPHAYTATPDDTAGGTWQPVTPDTAASFSAVGYYFGKTLRERMGDDTPIGLIESAFGGTPIESWLPREALVATQSEKAQQLVTDEAIAERLQANMQSNEEWEKARLAADPGITKPEWADFDYDASGWSTMVVPGLWDSNGPDIDGAVWFRHVVELTAEQAAAPATLHLGAIDDFDITWVNGTKVGQTGEDQPNWWQTRRVYDVPADLLREGRNVIAVRIFDQWQGGGFAGVPADMKLVTTSGDVPVSGLWLSAWEHAIVPDVDLRRVNVGEPQYLPTVLYHGMVRPVAPYAMRGFTWYQGESNAGQPQTYEAMLTQLMRVWREDFAGPETQPFLVVQLANFQARSTVPSVVDGWAMLRQAQAAAVAKDEAAGLAVAIDVGEADDIHPRNKKTVGQRLALHALADTYGLDIVASGPVATKAELTDAGVRLRFDHADGLKLNEQLGNASETFAVSDAAGNWSWARPLVYGETLLLTSDIAKPIAVRYAMQINPPAVLYNGADLPAVPFEIAVE